MSQQQWTIFYFALFILHMQISIYNFMNSQISMICPTVFKILPERDDLSWCLVLWTSAKFTSHDSRCCNHLGNTHWSCLSMPKKCLCLFSYSSLMGNREIWLQTYFKSDITSWVRDRARTRCLSYFLLTVSFLFFIITVPLKGCLWTFKSSYWILRAMPQQIYIPVRL